MPPEPWVLSQRLAETVLTPASLSFEFRLDGVSAAIAMYSPTPSLLKVGVSTALATNTMRAICNWLHLIAFPPDPVASSLVLITILSCRRALDNNFSKYRLKYSRRLYNLLVHTLPSSAPGWGSRSTGSTGTGWTLDIGSKITSLVATGM